MTPEEHFKDRPELLAEPLVQSLIAYMGKQFITTSQRAQKIVLKAMDLEHRSLSICMNSEVIVIGGTPCREAIEQILQLHQ